LCCIKTYELVKSTEVIEESKHEIEIDYPDDYIIGPPERSVAGVFSVPKDIPTLYDVAERRFPWKWNSSLASAT
jgi:hypothetical protein